MFLRVGGKEVWKGWQPVRQIGQANPWKKKGPVKTYSKTVNLPKTAFPLSMKDGIASRREVEIQKKCSFSELYSWQQQQEDRTKTFVLHDGPPYANGDPHVGHALNKIMKDISNRYKLLQGYKVEYVPGWDCHGMPIEQKALAQIKMDHSQLHPLEIRHKAKAFAERTIKRQSKAFQRWGVMADWQKNCYYTHSKQFEADQIEVFYQMYDKGFVYQDFMPVYWSPSARTALAEAELEYNNQHVSTSIYVKFPICHLPDSIHHQLGCDIEPFAVIWTTTPWTIPANQAICYGSGIKYCFAHNSKTNEAYLVCTDFVEKLSQIVGEPLEVMFTFEGHHLEGSTYTHPMRANQQQPLLLGNHVTVEKGTGLVHTAPAHGSEDFQVAIAHDLPVECHVDGEGRYRPTLMPELTGKDVLSDGNTTVLQMMEDSIIHQEAFEHSYPYDWRTKQPVIFRTSKQWFVNTEKIKDKALECLQDVKIIPKASGQGMVSQLNLRTYWCISRQRAWGVPIPVFYHKDTGEVLLNRKTIDHVQNLVRKHGTDCWWTLPAEELLPEAVVQESGFDDANQFQPGKDVLDIWFDSGSTWASVLNDSDQGRVADVYMEGLDQFGGWFQSSLLTSVAVQDKAPYKSLVVHGFAIDEEGRKMSKSAGNVVNPYVVINGGKDKAVEPAYGADVLRWWTAHSGLDHTVSIGPTVLDTCNDQIFRVRKSLRYLLGNLHGFDPEKDLVRYSSLLLQDQYALHLLQEFIKKVTTAYENYNYSQVIYLTEVFINAKVSGFYCNITKDRLYCSGKDSAERRSGQTVQYHMLESLTKSLAPILPHLAEELYQYPPFNTSTDSVFKTIWVQADQKWWRPDLAEPFELAMGMRDTFNSTICASNPVDFDVVICAKSTVFDMIKPLQEELTSRVSSLVEIMQCSTVSVLSRPPLVIPDESQPVEGSCSLTHPDGSTKNYRYLLVILPAEDFLCKRCRRYTAEHKHKLCNRCTDVMDSMEPDTNR